MHRFQLESAHTPAGWVRNVVATVSEQGIITALAPAADRAGADLGAGPAPPPIEQVRGVVVSGMANAHSHAFQRAMAGNTEYRLSARDSFWTWRNAMYALANRVEPHELQTIATQLFVEMLKSGYTTVAEFHYLHRRRDGTPYAGANALWDAVSRAAADAGIGLTFLPTLYQASDFGGRPLRADQARFESETEAFIEAVARRIEAQRRGEPALRTHRTGIAFHSLRAVPLANLHEVTRRLREIDADLPIHIHVAEQILEVKACQRETGKRPIELLLDTGLVDRHWCLVHATHSAPAELERLAAAGAAVCVSISTEANLGDGFFETARWLEAGGRLCVGSDSQSTVSPAEELRWLEYQQRLRKKRRAVLSTRGDPHVGTRLWAGAARAGAVALGQPAGAIEVGKRADFLVLDREHPAMAGGADETALDRLVFAGGDAAIRDVMVAGQWVIRERRHAREAEIRAAFGQVMRDSVS
ncbi:MAG TPA: formimidoylglutamate deiminase [Steroidobacteraceae bacterium]|nr:formimidoylglutamate deiminase [Steroidobacteraceae bacterium]